MTTDDYTDFKKQRKALEFKAREDILDAKAAEYKTTTRYIEV